MILTAILLLLAAAYLVKNRNNAVRKLEGKHFSFMTASVYDEAVDTAVCMTALAAMFVAVAIVLIVLV